MQLIFSSQDETNLSNFREDKRSRNNVAVLKSRSTNANKQHYNIKNIYAPDATKNMKSKVY